MTVFTRARRPHKVRQNALLIAGLKAARGREPSQAQLERLEQRVFAAIAALPSNPNLPEGNTGRSMSESGESGSGPFGARGSTQACVSAKTGAVGAAGAGVVGIALKKAVWAIIPAALLGSGAYWLRQPAHAPSVTQTSALIGTNAGAPPVSMPETTPGTVEANALVSLADRPLTASLDEHVDNPAASRAAAHAENAAAFFGAYPNDRRSASSGLRAAPPTIVFSGSAGNPSTTVRSANGPRAGLPKGPPQSRGPNARMSGVNGVGAAAATSAAGSRENAPAPSRFERGLPTSGQHALPNSAEDAADTPSNSNPGASDVDLVSRAQRALRASPASALLLAGECLRRAPLGSLAEEADVIAIRALVRLGRIDEARARTQRFTSRNPGSGYIDQIQTELAIGTRDKRP